MQPVGNFSDAWNWVAIWFTNMWPFIAIAVGLSVAAMLAEAIRAMREEGDGRD